LCYNAAMRTLISAFAACALLLGSCLTAPEAITLETDGALRRQVERLVDRHDGYVLSDLEISLEVQRAALGESAALEALVALPQVSRGALGVALQPVADRHDAYVRADTRLDADLEAATYLATSAQLRRLAGK
jgi:hypothetical protein